MRRSTALWVVIALAGIGLTAGVMAAASFISSQHVGLSSEPLSAGNTLAPTAVKRHPATKSQSTRRSAPRRTRRNPAPTTTTGSPRSVLPVSPPISSGAGAPPQDDSGESTGSGTSGGDD